MFGAVILVLPLLAPMIIFILACLFKGGLSYHFPDAHDFIFHTYTAREYRDLALHKRFKVKGYWSEKSGESIIFKSATTADMAIRCASDETHTGWGKFTANSASLISEDDEYEFHHGHRP